MDIKDFLNQKISCKIDGNFIKEGFVTKEDEIYYILQNVKDGSKAYNKMGYDYSWSIGIGSKESLQSNGITKLKLFEISYEVY